MTLTLIARGLTVLAGGCRYPTPRGEWIEKWCDECLLTQPYSCALEPLARERSQRQARARATLTVGAVTETGRGASVSRTKPGRGLRTDG